MPSMGAVEQSPTPTRTVPEVVTVEVHGGDDVELLGTGQHLLQGDVSDGVLDQHHLLPLAVAVGLADGGHDASDLLQHVSLLLGGHHVEAGLDGDGVLLRGNSCTTPQRASKEEEEVEIINIRVGGGGRGEQ